MCYIDLFFCGIEIEKSRANVVVDLPAKVFRFGLALVQRGFGLGDVAFDATTGKDWDADSSLESKYSMRMAERLANVTIVAVHCYHGIAFTLGRRKRLSSGFLS